MPHSSICIIAILGLFLAAALPCSAQSPASETPPPTAVQQSVQQTTYGAPLQVPHTAPASSAPATEHYRRAQTLAAQKKWDESKAELSEAMRLDPINTHVYYLFRSQVHRLEGDYDDAVRDAEMVMTLRPQVADAYLLRAMVWSKRGMHQQTVRDLDKALELEPETLAAYVMRGNAHRALGDESRALADYTEALRRSPKDATLHWNRGNAHWQLGHNAEAQADYEAALTLEPAKPQFLLTAASFHSTCADPAFRNAAKAFDYAKRAGEATNWTDWTALAALADAYAEAGDFANAGQMTAKALEAAPVGEHAWLRDRQTMFQAGKSFRTASKR
ncbi:MAG: hypothetical protein C0483_14580 [Pirellula sp.]|nr:hypothetical protein [Pirellula sp.]